MAICPGIDSRNYFSTLDVPDWVIRIPTIKKFFNNPVFRRRISLSHPFAIITNKVAFFIGVGIGYFLPLVPYLDTSSEIEILININKYAAIIMVIRLLGPVLMYSARGIGEILSTDKKDPILTTPIRNADLFYGICYGNLARGCKVIGVVFTFCIGTIVTYVAIAVTSGLLQIFHAGPWLETFYNGIGILAITIWFFLFAVLTLLLFTYSAAYFATFFDFSLSILLSIVYSTTILVFGRFYVVAPWLGENIQIVNELGFVFTKLAGYMVILGVVVVMVYGTGRAGLARFSRARCPGRYKPKLYGEPVARETK